MRIFFVFIILLPFYCDAQIITTYAGNGIAGYGGDGGGATAAEFHSPDFVRMNDSGYLFVSDYTNNVIRKINPTGIITTFAGNGTAGLSGDGGPATAPAKLSNPGGVAFDRYGNVFIADWGNNRIRKVNTAGVITTIAGTTGGYSGDGGQATNAKLLLPVNLSFDTSGNLYIADHYNHVVRMINTSGIISTFAGNGMAGNSGDGGAATSAEFYFPFDVKFDDTGNLYVVDDYNMNVRKINPSGIVSAFAGTGTAGYTADSIPATSSELWAPSSLAIDNGGNVFIADCDNQRIRKVDALGIITTVAGNGTLGYSGDGGLATAAEFDQPEGVALDACGNLYIADYNNERVRIVNYPVIAITLTNTLIVSPTDTVCSGTSVTFAATAIASSGTITYQWYVDGSIVSAISSTYTYSPANGDSIRCIATAANPCTSAAVSSNTIYMVVTPVIIPTITVTTSASAPIGSVVTINATVVGAGSSYNINWYDNAVLINTTTVPVVTYVKGAGVDVITATVVPGGEGECYDSTTSSGVSVAVNNEEAPSISPRGGGLSVFPNPVRNDLTVDLSPTLSEGEGGVTYRIMSVVGAVLQRGDLRIGSNSIDVSGLAAGVYVLEMTEGNGGKIITKIIKQ